MESLEEPYGDCGSKESIYTGLPYTQEDCSRRCYDDHLDTSCACIPASDAVINEAYRSMGYTYVKATNGQSACSSHTKTNAVKVTMDGYFAEVIHLCQRELKLLDRFLYTVNTMA